MYMELYLTQVTESAETALALAFRMPTEKSLLAAFIVRSENSRKFTRLVMRL